jgi:REP element-mobilizing transposase RayT
MSRNYRFHNPEGVYFVSFAVVNWLEVFTINKYKDILLDSLRYCQVNKGMEIFAWCIMTNHMHLVFRSVEGQKPGALLGDFKKFTSRKIVQAIKNNDTDVRNEMLLNQFKKTADKVSNGYNYQFWRQDNMPIERWSNKIIDQKINYIHNNPVAAGLVYRCEDYLYSSAVDYADKQGLLEGVIVV